MRSLSLQHVYLLQLLVGIGCCELETLQNIIYLAQHYADSVAGNKDSPLRFRDFVRSYHGVTSCAVLQLVDEMIYEGLVKHKPLQLTQKGKKTAQNMAGLLNYDTWAATCLEASKKYWLYREKANHEVISHIKVRRARIGENVNTL